VTNDSDLELPCGLIGDVVVLNVAGRTEPGIRICSVRRLRLDELDSRRPPPAVPKTSGPCGACGESRDPAQSGVERRLWHLAQRFVSGSLASTAKRSCFGNGEPWGS
jgi:hypothetical protein